MQTYNWSISIWHITLELLSCFFYRYFASLHSEVHKYRSMLGKQYALAFRLGAGLCLPVFMLQHWYMYIRSNVNEEMKSSAAVPEVCKWVWGLSNRNFLFSWQDRGCAWVAAVVWTNAEWGGWVSRVFVRYTSLLWGKWTKIADPRSILAALAQAYFASPQSKFRVGFRFRYLFMLRWNTAKPFLQ